MKKQSKQEYHREMINLFVNKKFSSYLEKHPADRTAAALYAVGALESILLSTLEELPYHAYNEAIQKFDNK